MKTYSEDELLVAAGLELPRCPDFGMVDPIEGYWWTPCVLRTGHKGPHVDSEGYSRYPLRKKLKDWFS